MQLPSEQNQSLDPAMLSLEQQAKLILKKNDKGGYTVPTSDMYPYQWNWDSAFVALGFAEFDIDRAIQEMETLFSGQWQNGMLPHIIFHTDEDTYFPGPSAWQTNQHPPSSGITQPPVAASVLFKLWKKTESITQNSDLKLRLKNLFPKVLAWHRWFHTYRDPDNLGVISITHPWESGRDNSPEWDAPAANVDTTKLEAYIRRDLDHADASMRPHKEDYDRYISLLQYGRDQHWDADIIGKHSPFRVADVGITMILMRANRDLLLWANELSETTAATEIQGWVACMENGINYLWDENSKTYCSRDLISGQLSGYVTSASFLAFYAGLGQDEQHSALINHWHRISKKVSYMTPSFDPENNLFDTNRYWRGPCWAVINYLIASGFDDFGLTKYAQQQRTDTCKLIELNGFQEAFSPFNGEGSGGGSFSWTAAIWLVMNS